MQPTPNCQRWPHDGEDHRLLHHGPDRHPDANANHCGAQGRVGVLSMRRKSVKTDQREKRMAKARMDFRLEMEVCNSCGVSCVGDVHEICSGQNRARAFEERAAWLHLCRECHVKVQNWPIEQQLALKKENDHDYYSLSAINRILAPRIMYEEDVNKWEP